MLSLDSRWAGAGWVVLAACVTLGQVGAGMRLPAWVLGLSPFHHVSRYPADDFSWPPAVLLTLLAATAASAA